MAPGPPGTDRDPVTPMPLRSSLASWRGGAPWAEWTRQRTTTVWLLLGVPPVVGALALLGGFSVGWCNLENECAPAQTRQLAVAAAVYLGSGVFFVIAATVVFALRRRFVWLLPGLLLGWALVSYLIP